MITVATVHNDLPVSRMNKRQPEKQRQKVSNDCSVWVAENNCVTFEGHNMYMKCPFLISEAFYSYYNYYPVYMAANTIDSIIII